MIMKGLSAGRNLPFFGLVAFALFSPISIAATNAAQTPRMFTEVKRMTQIKIIRYANPKPGAG